MVLLKDQTLVLELYKSQVFEDLHYLVHHNILLDLLHLMQYLLVLDVHHYDHQHNMDQQDHGHNILLDLLHLMQYLHHHMLWYLQYMLLLGILRLNLLIYWYQYDMDDLVDKCLNQYYMILELHNTVVHQMQYQHRQLHYHQPNELTVLLDQQQTVLHFGLLPYPLTLLQFLLLPQI